MRHFLFLLILLLSSPYVKAKDEDRKFGVEAVFGGGDIISKYSKDLITDEDQSNNFAINADYYLSRHIALCGGINLEEQGLMTGESNGIGLMKHYLFGIQVGAKWYPLAPKWILQPYIGTNLYTNVLNLPHQSGRKNVTIQNGESCSAVMDYDLQSSCISVSPKIGIDIRLISSLSLCLSCDYRWAFYGHANADLIGVSGNMSGRPSHCRDTGDRIVYNIGLKLDFPVREVNHDKVNSLLGTILELIFSKSNSDYNTEEFNSKYGR